MSATATSYLSSLRMALRGLPARTLLLLLASCSLSACVGAGTVTGHTVSWDVKDSGQMALCPGHPRSTVAACPIKSLSNRAGVRDITPDKLVGMWGPPDDERIENGRHKLTYRDGLAWRGLVVFVIAPIPLLAPLGPNDVTLAFPAAHSVQVQ